MVVASVPTPGSDSSQWGSILNTAINALVASASASEAATAKLTSAITVLTGRVSALEGLGGGTGGTGGAGTVVTSNAVDYSTTASQSSMGGSYTVAAGISALIAFVGYGNTSSAPAQVTTVTLGAAGFTKIDSSYSVASSLGRGVDIWYLLTPTAGAATVTANLAASQFGCMTVISVVTSPTGMSFTTTGKASSTAAASASCQAGTGAALYVGASLAGIATASTVGGGDTALTTPAVTNSSMSWAALKSTDATLATSWASAQQSAALMVGIIPGASVSSAPTIPSGSVTSNGRTWNQIYSEDFNTNAVLGTFTTASSSSSTLTSPAAYTASLSCYPTGYADTSGRGHYDPAKTLSVSGGSLHMDMFYDSTAGKYAVCAPSPKLPTMNGGRVTTCFRVTHGSDSFKFAWLWWPDTVPWPAGGEIDFPECNLTSKIGWFNHYANQNGGQDGGPTNPTTYVNDGAWHTVTTEWVSGTSVRFYLDNVLIGTATNQVSPYNMHFILQSETNIGGAVNQSDTANVEIAWITAYN